ncbi:MAG: cytochrome c3 family protein [Candidatus Latescibacterota bacterium]
MKQEPDNRMFNTKARFVAGLFVTAVVLLSLPFSRNPRGYPAAATGFGQSDHLDNVCPPFHLLDEEGNVIDPVNGVNADKPYSPKQTCGKCHDYDKITRGYHFMQGKGESATSGQRDRYLWVTTPGNYGGTWCSPAPLYRHLSPKQNDNPRVIDMTSFSFITAGCGACHPGGGPTEYDREGKRYDHRMSDPSRGFTSGGDNGLDGDYYKARWNETGVMEADCLLCHLPEFDMNVRNKQIEALNFRWAPTAGAGLAEITGSISGGTPVSVMYNKSRFNPDGTVSPHIVREPRNEACLSCHSKPGWKKRGANFSARTDVHLRAGMKCIDCHPAGSVADDDRIREREMHQFGKGDDPGGHVRDDLDNTVRDCASCHTSGKLGAPIARHRWLPPLHLDKIACQTCHIPERPVKAAQVQAGDVFNPGTKIPTKGRYLWTFYGPDMKYWNHYGDLSMMGYDDKPTDPFRPILARYKGKIYPVNRIHSVWPAIEIEGQKGLMQPKMDDIYGMWAAHRSNPEKYPALKEIRDDNGDTVPEINSPAEIEALISSVSGMLTETGYPMEGKRVVWVLNDRVYSSGSQYRTIEMSPWESSPYANVHKYSHDVYPARAALGINGCTDCHSSASDFFFARIVKYPFGEDAQPVTGFQYSALGLNGFWARLGVWREESLKPLLYALLAALFCAVIVWVGGLLLESLTVGKNLNGALRYLPWGAGIGCALLFLKISRDNALAEYMLPTRFWLDSNHFGVAVFIFMVTLIMLYRELRRAEKISELVKPSLIILTAGFALGGLSGMLMLLKLPIESITRLSYTLFDVSLVVMAASCAFVILSESIFLFAKAAYTEKTSHAVS